MPPRFSDKTNPTRKLNTGHLVKNLATEPGPRERLLSQGAHTLSNAELLAILLRTGSQGRSALELASTLLKENQDSLLAVLTCQPRNLVRMRGIKAAKAATLGASLELVRRALGENLPTRQVVREPEDVAGYLCSFFRGRDQELLWALFLDQKHRILGHRVIARGTLTQAAVYPREIVKACLDIGAAAMVLAHNHPSGDPKPSVDDRRITLRLRDALATVDVNLLDHLVIGDGTHVSLSRLGWL